MNAAQIFAELNAAIENSLIVPNTLLPEKLHGKDIEQKNADGTVEILVGGQPLKTLAKKVNKPKSAKEKRAEQQAEKKRRTEIYQFQVNREESLEYTGVNEHLQYQAEIRFVAMLVKCGVIDLDD